MTSISLEAVSKTFYASAMGPVVAGGGLLAKIGSAIGRRPAARAGEPGGETTVVRALSDIDLAISSGETLAVVGPSGCGKSTLLRVIAGLEKPDQGRVLYDGVDVAHLPPGARRIGMVFQSYALYPNMTSKDNLSFYFRLRHRAHEVDERVRITARTLGVGFTELLDKKPPKLSRGQQQRVAIGRCIIRDPSVFLFDEPLASVDAKLRVRTRAEIKRLLYRFGITSVYVTHDQTEAITLGDRLAVMREGRIEQIGTYKQLVERPDNLFVAGFVGLRPMSFFAGVLQGQGVRLGDGHTIDLIPAAAARAVPGQAVTVGVRARDVRLREPAGGEGLLGVVEVVERVPSERARIARVRIGSANVEVHVDEDAMLKPGYVVRLDLIPERTYLFDTASGRALWPPVGGAIAQS